MRLHTLHLVLAAIMLIAVSACGFHLRGLDQGAGDARYIVRSSGSAVLFAENLERTLIQRNMWATEDSETHQVVNIHTLQWQQRKLAVDEQGRGVQWQLVLEAAISVANPDAAAVESDDWIRLAAADQWTADPSNALSESADKAQIQAAVETRLLEKIIQTLIVRQNNGN